MTCPTCGRRIRAQLVLGLMAHRITADTFLRLDAAIPKEHDMTHLTLIISPTAGDIGIEEEEWEVLPTQAPVEAPVEVPSEPVPA